MILLAAPQNMSSSGKDLKLPGIFIDLQVNMQRETNRFYGEQKVE